MKEMAEEAEAALYGFLAEAEELKSQFLRSKADRYPQSFLGHCLEEKADQAAEMAKCFRAAGREASESVEEKAAAAAKNDALFGLGDRVRTLLRIMQLEEGDWSPARAATALGNHVTTGRALAIMKKLAERGLAEKLSPRSLTYRLTPKGEAEGK